MEEVKEKNNEVEEVKNEEQSEEQRKKIVAEKDLDETVKAFRNMIDIMSRIPTPDKKEFEDASKEFLNTLKKSKDSYVDFIDSLFSETADPTTLSQTQTGVDSKINQYNYFIDSLNDIKSVLNSDSNKMVEETH